MGVWVPGPQMGQLYSNSIGNPIVGKSKLEVGRDVISGMAADSVCMDGRTKFDDSRFKSGLIIILFGPFYALLCRI